MAQYVHVPNREGYIVYSQKFCIQFLSAKPSILFEHEIMNAFIFWAYYNFIPVILSIGND